MKVRYKRCDECLFGPNKIVSDSRRASLLKRLQREDSHFICHKATIEGEEVTCRGDYDRNPYRTNSMRIASRLGVVRFCDDHGAIVSADRAEQERTNATN